jgi:pyridoxamine 5'-phosphate oxidase
MRASYRNEPSGAVSRELDEALDVSSLADGWLPLLSRWIVDAAEFVAPDGLRVAEPNAMVLATVAPEGGPATRTVLCKGVDEQGLYFYTNYRSRKAQHLADRPRASATFPWYAMHRQVHVRGPVRMVSAEETAQYWATRPRGSQLGAWASRQSEPIASRADLVAAYEQVSERFANDELVPVPDFWGGYLLQPEEVEFWQGRPDRLHNRVRARIVEGEWLVERLQP